MESKNRNQNRMDNSTQQVSDNRRAKKQREGFEGMNFEEQRGSYKNSDGAGVNGKPRDGQSAPE
jgi:hypothetical protein